MIPFLNSPLVTIQNKFVILQFKLVAGARSLCGYLRLARGHSADSEQAREAFDSEEAEILFRDTYQKLLQRQPAGTFHWHPGQPGRHKEQAELPTQPRADSEASWRLLVRGGLRFSIASSVT